MADARWYAVRTNPRCEDRAVASIAGKGFATYFPQARKHIVHHRTRVLLPKAFPLLVGYVLVDLPSAGHAGHLRGCDGVKSILGVGGTPLPLPGREVQAIMEAETAMNEAFEREKRAMERKDHGLVAGEKVRFSRGAWSGFEATVVDAKSKRAIKVLMEVFGRMTEMEAPVDFLQRAA